MMRAELVSATLYRVDIKVINGDRMHVLQWRRRLTYDEVLLDGKRNAISYGLFSREHVYGLVFGQDENRKGGEHVMLILDPRTHYGVSGKERISGVRVEVAEGALIAFGSLDPKSLEKPKSFSDWMKKSIGMEWGDDHAANPPH